MLSRLRLGGPGAVTVAWVATGMLLVSAVCGWGIARVLSPGSPAIDGRGRAVVPPSTSPDPAPRSAAAGATATPPAVAPVVPVRPVVTATPAPPAPTPTGTPPPETTFDSSG